MPERLLAGVVQKTADTGSRLVADGLLHLKLRWLVVAKHLLKHTDQSSLVLDELLLEHRPKAIEMDLLDRSVYRKFDP